MTNWSDMTVSTVLRIGGVITRSISFKTEVVDLPALCRLTMLHLRLLEILELKGTSKPTWASSTYQTCGCRPQGDETVNEETYSRNAGFSLRFVLKERDYNAHRIPARAMQTGPPSPLVQPSMPLARQRSLWAAMCPDL